MAKILQVSSGPSPALFDTVCACLNQNGIIAVATESFYALAASAILPEAVDRVVRIKGRPSDKPILTLIGEQSQLALLVQSIPSWAQVLIDHFWPGPLTLIFSAHPHLPHNLTSGTGTIGVRQPGNNFLRALLCQTGPLTGTSANRSGSPPPLTAKQVEEAMGSELDLILDSGPAGGGLPSTILNLVGTPSIVRDGPISRNEIEKVLSEEGITLKKAVAPPR